MCSLPSSHPSQPESVAYTCETAAHFWLLHVLARWERFSAAAASRKGEAGAVKELFPFKDYFSDVQESLFKGASYELVCAAGVDVNIRCVCAPYGSPGRCCVRCARGVHVACVLHGLCAWCACCVCTRAVCVCSR